jgi:hypothetical protein
VLLAGGFLVDGQASASGRTIALVAEYVHGPSQNAGRSPWGVRRRLVMFRQTVDQPISVRAFLVPAMIWVGRLGTKGCPASPWTGIAGLCGADTGRKIVATFSQEHQTVYGGQVNLEYNVSVGDADTRLGWILRGVGARVYGDVPAGWVASIEEAGSALGERNPGRARSLLERVKCAAEAAGPFAALAAALADLVKVI